jgi:hypothetical protein
MWPKKLLPDGTKEEMLNLVARSDVSQYLYACVQRGARRLLEQRCTLPPRGKHKNGVELVFWAEESVADADRE